MASKQENEGGVFVNVGSLAKKCRVKQNGMALMFNKVTLCFMEHKNSFLFSMKKWAQLFQKCYMWHKVEMLDIHMW